jgi:hypothetical protein
MLAKALPNSRAPSLRGHYPASSLLRARPPPSRRQPISRTTGYTAYPAPPISRRDEEGFSFDLTCPGRRAVARTPPEGSRRVSQTATVPAAFAQKARAQPPELGSFEATLAFTHVTARLLAHHPSDGLVDGLQGFGFLPPCHPSYGTSGSCPDGSTSH